MAGDRDRRSGSSRGGDKRKRNYRLPSRQIEGPGVWVTCVKGKEKQAVGELHDLFTSLGEELWPIDSVEPDLDANDSDNGEEDELSIEAQVAKELGEMTTKRPRKQQRFTNCLANTQCVIFISCRPPVDPVQLVVTHVDNVMKTGITRTKFVQRMVPSTNTCYPNASEITSLCSRIFNPFFEKNAGKIYKFKIDLRVRNHTSLSRPELIALIASCVPPEQKVELDNPQLFILVEVFKSVCGICIVEDYYSRGKFNVMELANTVNSTTNFSEGSGRLAGNNAADGNSNQA